MNSSYDLHQEVEAARVRAARLGHEGTARALAGIAAMIATLEAEGCGAGSPRPPSSPGAPPHE